MTAPVPLNVSHAIQWSALAALTLMTSPLHAEVINFLITIDGLQEVPSNSSPASGTGTATLDTATNRFSWEFSFSGLESAQTAAHFHGSADLCQEAAPIVSLPLGEFVQGSTIITPAQAQSLLAGLIYVNIHSADFPEGEIRGQIELAPPENTIPEVIQKGDEFVKLTPVMTGLDAPVGGFPAPGHAGRLMIPDQSGLVWNLNLLTGSSSIYLDTSDLLVPLGIFGEGTYDERGLLGFAFDPRYAQNGLVYTYTSEPWDPGDPADFSTMPDGSIPNHVSVVREWHVKNPGDADATVDPASSRIVMRIDQPQFNHNGGQMNFGPDGMLYISLGDGGSADDQDGGLDPFGLPNLGHDCRGNGADAESILGKLLRIDPHGRTSPNGAYGIPADNPFVNGPGIDEAWATGFRNPFRFSFDKGTGDLWLADVGQNNVEEVNVISKAGDYGWNRKEGSFKFVPNGYQAGYAVTPEFSDFTGLIDPVAEYDHDEGISVIGGYVYRGAAIPSLEGYYVFADYARTFATDGRLFFLDPEDISTVQEFNIADQDNIGLFTTSIGQDSAGNLYVMGNTNFVPFGGTGVVWRIDPTFTIHLEGPCPGPMELLVEGATPNARVALLVSRSAGSEVIPPSLPCAGALLDLASPIRIVQGVNINSDGTGSAILNIPAGACGRAQFQAINLDTCETTNVISP